VLGSGLYLWLRKPRAAPVPGAEVEPDAEPDAELAPVAAVEAKT